MLQGARRAKGTDVMSLELLIIGSLLLVGVAFVGPLIRGIEARPACLIWAVIVICMYNASFGKLYVAMVALGPINVF